MAGAPCVKGRPGDDGGADAAVLPRPPHRRAPDRPPRPAAGARCVGPVDVAGLAAHALLAVPGLPGGLGLPVRPPVPRGAGAGLRPDRALPALLAARPPGPRPALPGR